MKKAVRLTAVVAVLAIVAAACSKSSSGGSSGTPTASASSIPRGGILHIAQVGDVSAAFDPAREYYQVSFEYMKCCLLRTLFTTNGLPADQGGAVLQPDLAAALPTVSSDGLTWTISIKPGIMYSPPFQTTEVTAQDFIRAMEREADPKVTAAYGFYYTAIKGYSDYTSGKSKTISGMTALDSHTLQIKVTAPTGDLGWRFALPASAPIPPNGNALYGAAQGHDKDYGRFLVGTGPYMWQGIDKVNFSLPASKQTPVAGYIPGRQMVLVRNPSWDPATDPNRPAYVDQIQTTIGGSVADLYNKVQTGEVDWVMDAQPPADVLAKYSTNPSLQPFLHTYAQNAVTYTSMNLAVPPFDDIHVRKAMNFILDKAGGRQLAGGPLTGVNAGHIFPDGLTNNILKSYDPYATANSAGDVAKAMAEMKLSKYDTNHDGKCDASVCQNILALTFTTDPGPREAALWNSNVQKIGMSFNIKALDTTTFYAKCNDMPSDIPICLTAGWVQDYPDPYTFGPPLFKSTSLFPSCCNYSALGATSAQLKKWGYSVTSVPSVDTQLSQCAAIAVGDARTQCWTNFDKYIMENVVPWVPRTFTNENDITSTNVVNYSFDEFGGLFALDHAAMKPGT
jgi:peptide/nickel transport system substrate-binding protein